MIIGVYNKSVNRCTDDSNTIVGNPRHAKRATIGTMSIQAKKRWTLIEHFRGLGIEPEAPFHPVWLDLENHWGADFKREITLTPVMLEKLDVLGLPAAPLAVTLYKWAAANNIKLTPFKGTVNADPRVRQAMCEYATARIQLDNTFYRGMDVMLQQLIKQEPLPKNFSNMLDRTFNQKIDSNDSLTAWLAPLTGRFPAISTWKAISKRINHHYALEQHDLQAFSDDNIKQEHHWYKNHRMELVLAAWLETDSKYLSIPLYNHLPNISMETPDQVTTVFWLVAKKRIENDPHGEESRMLTAWMKQYPVYRDFLQNRTVVVENVMGDDPVVCGKWLHQLWVKNHVEDVSTLSLDGMLEP